MDRPGDTDRVLREPPAGLMALLGLSRLESAGCRLVLVESLEGSVRLHFDWKRIGTGVVTVGPDDGLPAFISVGGLSVRYSGREVGRPWAILMSALAAGMRGRDIDALMIDCGLRVPASDESAGLPVSRPFNPIMEWAPEDGWRHFQCEAAMERRYRETFEFDTDSSFFVHGDLECRFVSPGCRVRLPGNFIYPFDLFSHTEAVGPVTDLNDEDVIRDPSQKIEKRILKEVEAGRVHGPVVVIATCVPVVIAEDPGPVLDRLSSVCPAGIDYITPVSSRTPSEVFMASFGPLRREVLSMPARRRTVGLVGYRPGHARDDLVELLAGEGIQVTGAIVPQVTSRMLWETLAAQVIVVAPSRYHEANFNSLIEGASGAGRRIIRPPYPWGVDATVEWLSAVKAGLGLESAGAGRIEALSREATALVAERVPGDAVFVLVTDIAGLPGLCDPLSPSGLPVLSMMAGLGLRTRVLVYLAAREEEPVRSVFERLSATLPARARVELRMFRDEAGLREALTDPEVAGVYSEMAFDYRATRAGIAPFSSRIFEPGLSGASRTAMRFARLAGLPFYHRYVGSLSGRWRNCLV
ncbi:MAG TPA: nitrogenase component 1 [Myxococcota bacterium]|nr:nitrogenase component 1 [Myxococcota bacterium]